MNNMISTKLNNIEEELLKILSRYPDLEGAIPIGSLSVDHKNIQTHGSKVLDLDWLILLNTINYHNFQILSHELSKLCERLSDEHFLIDFGFINSAYKPNKKDKYQIFIHLLLHDKQEFINNQPKIFLFSWGNKESIIGNFKISNIYDGTAPSISDILYCDYGLYDSINLIKSFPLHKIQVWDISNKLNPQDKFIRLSNDQSIDLICYFILWCTCNTVRAVTKNYHEINHNTINLFEKLLNYEKSIDINFPLYAYEIKNLTKKCSDLNSFKRLSLNFMYNLVKYLHVLENPIRSNSHTSQKKSEFIYE